MAWALSLMCGLHFKFLKICCRLVQGSDSHSPLPKRKKGVVWSVSQLGCMFGSSAHGCRCAQISRREQTTKAAKSAGRVGMGQWAFQPSGQLSAAMAVGLHQWGVTWPQTTQPLPNGLLKKWAFHVSCKQTHPHRMGAGAPCVGLECLFLIITTACSHTATGRFLVRDCFPP